ncbi:UDP-N-acetylglucosamine--LPS N-acetylglucosamine transferase [Salipiger pacificus]|uniref:UDP-N-acetylglucosamine--LPS N-acetylglucosamine transferase n=1 Tax=Salipiger mangrovisoli TaxID=2865933 RepID=A0ABR9XA38_9RHOB|nr:UDP-N-acetylglucosamine--LPS N-acetylglucosamine transferase [Salipiger mangrovisoli]MBE9640453.1 UDP-N-acetylglucosamine--LPS N-acetylglucosamine transferase [Salipiger mangrovisoli]
MKTPPRRKPVLAVASAGGHWQQLQRLRGALDAEEVFFLTTLPGLPEEFGALPAAIVPDCNQSRPVSVIRSAVVIFGHVLRLRPKVVVTTGALPGLIALAAGRVVGARGIWIDSVANAERMSASGRMARHVAHLRLSQWEHVARETQADYAGSVL